MRRFVIAAPDRDPACTCQEVFTPAGEVIHNVDCPSRVRGPEFELVEGGRS